MSNQPYFSPDSEINNQSSTPVDQSINFWPEEMPNRNEYEDVWIDRAIYKGFELPADLRIMNDAEDTRLAAIRPIEGYRMRINKEIESGKEVPVLQIAVSRERILDLFSALVFKLGNEINVVADSYYLLSDGGLEADFSADIVQSFYRNKIDSSIFLSHCATFEETVVDDCQIRIAAISGLHTEVILDECKGINIRSNDYSQFDEVLKSFSLSRNDAMLIVADGNHGRRYGPARLGAFRQFRGELGMNEPEIVI